MYFSYKIIHKLSPHQKKKKFMGLKKSRSPKDFFPSTTLNTLLNY